MRPLTGFLAVLLLSGLAVGQATFGPDHPHWTPPGAYAAPFVPLVSTPSVSAETIPTPSVRLGLLSPTVGASNATGSNASGAANATLSLNLTAPAAEFAPLTWYGPAAHQRVEAGVAEEAESLRRGSGFESGAALFQDSYGAAQLAAGSRPRGHATPTYTNPDVARVNDTNGLVKFRGKTEHVE